MRDLFGNLIESVQPATYYPWSHSRINFLDSCPRKYYYHYYVAKKKTAKNAPDKNQAMILAHLGTKHLLLGTIIHSTIELYFKKYKSGSNYNLNYLLQTGYQRLEDAITLTRNARNNPQFNFPNSTDKIFKELFYGSVNEVTFKEELSEKIKLNLTNFFNAEAFAEFRQGGKQKSSELEKWVIFKLMNYASIKGKLDLTFVDQQEQFNIVDWKTGNVENEESSLQLLIYAIWAQETKKIEQDSMRLYKAYLQEQKVEELQISEEFILRAKMKVIQDTQAIEQLHNYGVNGIDAAFSKIKFPNKICPQCPFEEICHKS